MQLRLFIFRYTDRVVVMTPWPPVNGFLPNRKVSTPYLKVETTTTTTSDNLNNLSANKRQSANYTVKSTSGNVSRAMAQLLFHWLASQGSFERASR